MNDVKYWLQYHDPDCRYRLTEGISDCSCGHFHRCGRSDDGKRQLSKDT